MYLITQGLGGNTLITKGYGETVAPALPDEVVVGGGLGRLVVVFDRGRKRRRILKDDEEILELL